MSISSCERSISKLEQFLFYYLRVSVDQAKLSDLAMLSIDTYENLDLEAMIGKFARVKTRNFQSKAIGVTFLSPLILHVISRCNDPLGELILK